MKNLYDENWNVMWNADVNSSGQLPPEYSDFNSTWFDNTTHGTVCSTNDTGALCYVNITSNMVWVQIPHFSGNGPEISGDPPGSMTQSIALASGWNLISMGLNI